MVTPLCKNCASCHYVEAASYMYVPYCYHPSIAPESPVTGETVPVPPEQARAVKGKCGPKGKFFRPASARRVDFLRWFG